jgi:hypothetical protein
MRHLVSTFGLCFFLFLFPVISFCQTPITDEDQPTAVNGDESNSHFSWGESAVFLTAGYRTDKLNWHIAGNLQGTHPNIQSELTWSDLKIFQIKIANRTVIKDHLYLRGYLDYGKIISGENRDSDYNGDDRTIEFSRSLNRSDGNHVLDGSVGIGPRFSFSGSTLTLCPLIGYALSEQDLNMVDGNQALTWPGGPPLGPIAGLNSRYEAYWKGPWIGVDLLLSAPFENGPFKKIDVIVTGEYHWVDYDADANWNLRSDFAHPVSFSHEADGNGIVASVDLFFEINRHLGWQVGMDVTEMTTDAGVDRTYFSDGRTSDTRLNEVRWRSFTVETGISYQF